MRCKEKNSILLQSNSLNSIFLLPRRYLTSSKYIVISPFLVAAAIICTSPFENAVARMAPFAFDCKSVGYSKKTLLIELDEELGGSSE